MFFSFNYPPDMLWFFLLVHVMVFSFSSPDMLWFFLLVLRHATFCNFLMVYCSMEVARFCSKFDFPFV